jgi:hypothetical protein
MLKPLSAGKWSFTSAAHLLNRAGFGGPPAEIEKLANLGPDRAVSLLLDYEAIPDTTPAPDWAKPDPERMRQLRAMRLADDDQKRRMRQEERKLQRQQMMELRGWWFRRMATGPRPFQEKMVLFWHGHFATSVEKVRDAYYMWRQNELFRRLATASWLQILVEVAKDPAMLIWLDQAQSRKDHPNENFAREVMELFALGEGHYTEKDVTEAARALTGWSLDREQQEFVNRPRIHDEGNKTVLGTTGNLDGVDVLEQIIAQPQAARFITAKLWNYFAGEVPSAKLNEALARVFRQSGNHFKPLLRVMFRCEEFYSPSLIRAQVKSPVQWLVGSVRMLESELPPPIVCWGLTRNLGQDLFAPPNVKGWDGGLTWITTNTLLARYNEAAVLVQGDLSSLSGVTFAGKPGRGNQADRLPRHARAPRVDVEKILTEKERTDRKLVVAALEKRMFQTTLHEKQTETLHDFLDSKGELDENDILGAIRLLMSTPQYQVT